MGFKLRTRRRSPQAVRLCGEPVRLSWGQRRGIAGEPVRLSWGQRRRTCRRASSLTKKEDLPESQFACIADKEGDLPEGLPNKPKGRPTRQTSCCPEATFWLVMGNVAISSCLARRLPAKPYYHPLIRGGSRTLNPTFPQTI